MSDMRCSSCNSTDRLLWAHNGGVMEHQWGDESERDCKCQPQMICGACDAPLIQQHGLVVLAASCFGYPSSTLQ